MKTIEEITLKAKELGYTTEVAKNKKLVKFTKGNTICEVFIRKLYPIQISYDKTRVGKDEYNNELSALFKLANETINALGKYEFCVSYEVADSNIAKRFDNFEKAKEYFHKIEKDFENKGYDLDDDTTELDIDDCFEDNFFNNLSNDNETIRLFLDAYLL